MPARQFFAMLRAGRKVRAEYQNAQYAEFCDIAFIPGAKADYGIQMKKAYLSRMNITTKNPKVLDAASPETGRILSKLFGGIR